MVDAVAVNLALLYVVVVDDVIIDATVVVVDVLSVSLQYACAFLTL